MRTFRESRGWLHGGIELLCGNRSWQRQGTKRSATERLQREVCNLAVHGRRGKQVCGIYDDTIMHNLRRAINASINTKGKVHNFRMIDTQHTYRVVKMLAAHWKCDVKTAYRKYAEYLYNEE